MNQKKTFFLFIISMCCFLLTDAQRFWKESITGEGEVIRKKIDVRPADGIILGFSGNVVLTQGSQWSVEAEGQENILDNITTELKNGIWRINYDKNVKRAKEVTVYIQTPGLAVASLSGSGNITSTNRFKNLDEIEVGISGSGNILLELDAKKITSGISGSGNINLEGFANELDISISGSGDFDAKDLEVADCSIKISGSGDAEVNVKDNLDARVSGSGDIVYSGRPNLDSRSSGSGHIRSRN